MLYQIYDAQRALMEPFAEFAQATAKLYANPTAPLGASPLAQRMAAGYELLYRLGKDYEKPTFGIQTVEVDGVEVAISERVVKDKPFCELRRFKRFSDNEATLAKMVNQPAVLIVAPLSGHYATLLRDTVKSMLKGHKVFITDWRNARLVPLEDGEFHLSDYINYVQEFIRDLQDQYGDCHVMSVCQPTVPVLAAVSLMASRGEKLPLSMTMMGGPIDARRSPTAVNTLATNRDLAWFENNVIYRVPPTFAGAGRRVYPGFLQHTGFVAMNPDRHAQSHYDFFEQLMQGDEASAEQHRKFYDEYNAVLDMDADYYLETIDVVFQQFSLVEGTWDVANPDGVLERVRPADIKGCALLTIEGELDDISGSGQTEAAQDLCSGIAKDKRRHIEVKGAGHYGIFAGSRWRNVVYPEVQAFIQMAQGSRAVGRGAMTKVAGPAASAAAQTASSASKAAQVAAGKTPAPKAAPKKAAPKKVEATKAKTATKTVAKTAAKKVIAPAVVAQEAATKKAAPAKRAP
jgi:poly(3-hydroxybutyrate) depolymerase